MPLGPTSYAPRSPQRFPSPEAGLLDLASTFLLKTGLGGNADTGVVTRDVTGEWLAEAAQLIPSERARLAARLIALQDGDAATSRRWMETSRVKQLMAARAAGMVVGSDTECCFCGRTKDVVASLVGVGGVFLCCDCSQILARGASE